MTDTNLLPNLFVLGPPKCGTSSLFDWLVAHPDVVGTVRKETFYLTDEEHPLRGTPSIHDCGLAGYATLFDPAQMRKKVRVDATTHHLYSRTALATVSALPGARVCVVLRDPAVRLLSSFYFTQHNRARISPAVKFAEVVDRLLSGQSVQPDICDHPVSGFVLDRDLLYGEYWRHLQPWLNALGAGRVLILRFEDLIREPRFTMRRVADFVGIDAEQYEHVEFSKRNATIQPRSPLLHRNLLRVAQYFPQSALRGQLRLWYDRLLGRKPDRAPEDAMALARLRQYYAESNFALGQALGWDVSSWSVTPATPLIGKASKI